MQGEAVVAGAALRGGLHLRHRAPVAAAPVHDVGALGSRRHHVAGDDLEAGREGVDLLRLPAVGVIEGGFGGGTAPTVHVQGGVPVGGRVPTVTARRVPCAARRPAEERPQRAERVDRLVAVELVVVRGARDAWVDDRVIRRRADRRLALDDELAVAPAGRERLQQSAGREQDGRGRHEDERRLATPPSGVRSDRSLCHGCIPVCDVWFVRSRSAPPAGI